MVPWALYVSSIANGASEFSIDTLRFYLVRTEAGELMRGSGTTMAIDPKSSSVTR